MPEWPFACPCPFRCCPSLEVTGEGAGEADLELVDLGKASEAFRPSILSSLGCCVFVLLRNNEVCEVVRFRGDAVVVKVDVVVVAFVLMICSAFSLSIEAGIDDEEDSNDSRIFSGD